MAKQPDRKDDVTDEKEGLTPADNTQNQSDSLYDTVSRRSFLELSAAAGALGALGTASATSSSTTTVDIVEAGADPTGEEPIDGVLESVVGDGVVVEFPSDGVFRISGANLTTGGFELRGNGATLAPDGGLFTVNAYNWQIDGFEIDQRIHPGYARMSVNGGNYEVSRCIWRGKAGSGNGWAVVVRADPDTSAQFTDCYWPDGAVDGGESSDHGCIGMFQDYTSGATVTFERCWFHCWSEDTIYASKPNVDLRLIDCYFHNTIVGPRVSDVTMRGCTCVNDGPIPVEDWSGSSFQAGLWLNGEKGTYGEPVIEDCDMYIVHSSGTHPVKGGNLPGPLTMRDTRIHNETGGAAIWADDAPSNFYNITISGNNTDVAANQSRTEDVTAVSGEAADPSPPIPTPPPEGSIPGGEGSSDSGSTDSTDGGEEQVDPLAQEHELKFVAESGTPGRYEVHYTGENMAGAPITEGDCETELTSGVGIHAVDETTESIVGYASGNDCDAWGFTGEVTTVDVPEGLRLELDGETVSPEELKAITAGEELEDDGPVDPSEMEYELKFVAESGASGHYEVDYTGENMAGAPITEGDCETELTSGVGILEPEDGIERINGWASGNDCDAWGFTGEVTRVLAPEGLRLELDGETVTPEELKAITAGDDEPEWRRIRIDGDGDPSTGATFEFQVSGKVESLMPAEENHDVGDSSVTADSWRGYMVYRFTGDVTSFDLEGPATVSIDGTEVSPSDVVSSE